MVHTASFSLIVSAYGRMKNVRSMYGSILFYYTILFSALSQNTPHILYNKDPHHCE